MKKNKMLRIASILLVVTLLSTCVISGTFAKYVTKASGSDSARVAKWGVLAELEAGKAFDWHYETTDTSTYSGEYSVEAFSKDENDKVVAPGTSSEDLGSTIKGKLTGQPEVATKYEFKIDNLKDIYVAAGEYKDYTELKKQDDGTYAYEDWNLANDYAPIVWTFKVNGTALATNKSLTEIMSRMDEIAAHIGRLQLDGIEVTVETTDNGGINIIAVADPNVNVDMEFELSWKWVFYKSDEVDKADTLLGNIAADESMANGNDFSTVISADVTVSATQID